MGGLVASLFLPAPDTVALWTAFIIGECLFALGAVIVLKPLGLRTSLGSVVGALRSRRAPTADVVARLRSSSTTRVGLALNLSGAILYPLALVVVVARNADSVGPASALIAAFSLADMVASAAARAPLWRLANPNLTSDQHRRLRSARRSDLPALVDLDLWAFRRVYETYGLSPRELFEDMTEKYERRFRLLGPRWILVVETSRGIEGSMILCPTNKGPDDFVSWEDTTDSGTLASTFEPNGAHIYVVSLALSAGAASDVAYDMLFAGAVARFVSAGYYGAYFESRMPGFRRWLRSHRPVPAIDRLTETRRAELAAEYLEVCRRAASSSTVPDPLLGRLLGSGARLLRVVPNAYQDEPSLNFGVLGIYDNPMPPMLRRIPGSAQVFGRALFAIARRPRLLSRFL